MVPPGSKIPYRADALAKRKDNFDHRETADTVKKCYLPGVPRITLLPMPFQIFQSGKYVAIVYQYAHAYRTIYIDGTKHLDGVDFWMGDSRGHWEGDTLVVDIANFNDQTWLDAAGELSQRRAARGGALHAHRTPTPSRTKPLSKIPKYSHARGKFACP